MCIIFVSKFSFMGRIKNNRVVNEPPLFSSFKPIGVPGRSLDEILLSLDEYEAIRLADYHGFSHEEAADEMGVSRSTFSRLIVKSRKQLATFLIQGKILKVDGGQVHFKNNVLRCNNCGYMFRRSIQVSLKKCPECNSENIENFAGAYGHGHCCKDHN